RAIDQPRAERVSIPPVAQRRDQVAIGVEVADIPVAQMHMVCGYVAGNGHAGALRLAYDLHPLGAGQTTKVDARAGFAREYEDCGEGNGFRTHRDAGQSQSRRYLAVMGNAAA